MNFSLNDREIELASEFMNRLRLEYTGAIGGQFTFEFTNTSLGQIASVYDNVSKERLVLTDFDTW
jgi:hypothetical protein